MRGNQVYSSPDSAAGLSPTGGKADGAYLVPGSFRHLRHASLYGQDRRSLINYYREQSPPGAKAQGAPVPQLGAPDEVHGSVDSHTISREWAEALSHLSPYVDPDVWPVLARKFIPMFEQACRQPDIVYQLWEPPSYGQPRGWWKTRVASQLRTFGVPGDSLMNPWVPRGPLPPDSALSPPELCKRLTRRYMRYLERLHSVSIYDHLAFFSSKDSSVWATLKAAGFAYRMHQVDRIATAHQAGLTKPGAKPGLASEYPVEWADFSDEHSRRMFRSHSVFELPILLLLALSCLATQLLLPVLMLLNFTRDLDSETVCPMNAEWFNRVLFFFLFLTVVVYSTFPEYAQNNFLTYDIFLHSHATTNPFSLKLGRFINDFTLLLVIPSVTFYLFMLNPKLEELLLNCAAVTFLSQIDEFAARFYEQFFMLNTGSASLASHVKSKLLLEYLIKGSKFNLHTRLALNARNSLVGVVVKSVFSAAFPIAAITMGMYCLGKVEVDV